MTLATREDILRLFPDLPDHAVVEMLETRATVDDLETAMALLQNDDAPLVGGERRDSNLLHDLVGILDQSGYEAEDDQ